MRKRALSLLLVLVMVLSMLPSPVYAVTVGEGTAENPYQIGDIVTNDGSAEPDGYTVENSYWARTSDVPATENIVCQVEGHDHVIAGCTAAYETVECMPEGHPAEGETGFTHEDGTVCSYDAEQAKWMTNVDVGYTCGVEAHTHTVEGGCITEVPAYTVWTLTQNEQTPPPADNALSTLELEPLAEEDEKGLPIHYFLASPGNIDNPNGDYINYGTTGRNTWPESYVYPNIKEDANWNQIKTETGIRNVYDETIVTDYVAYWPGNDAAAFKEFGSVTIDGITYTDDKYEIKWVSIMYRDNNSAREGLYCSQYGSANYEHIHIDGLLVEKIQPGEMEVYKTIPSAVDTMTTFQFTLQKMLQADLVTPPASADAVDTSFAPMTLTASIPAGQTQAQIVGGSEISFGYYKLTENSSQEWENAGIELTDGMGRTQTFDTDTLYICIAPNGTVQYSTTVSGPYTVMDHVAVQNERKDVKVTYQWRVYNLDGSVSEDLPASVGAHGLPASVEGVKVGTDYVYNTGYVQGTSYHDYENGLLYTFHGWDTYSHSSVFNVDPSATGYSALDDGDTDASNNKTIPITADTWINGYWTVSELPAAEAYLLVHKDVVVSSGDAGYVKNYLQNIGKMFISIDPGIDKDGDGKSQIDVDYPGAVAEGGYKINVYQYATPFEFSEHQAEVPGYTRTVDITVSGSNLTLTAENGDDATVTIAEEYDPAQAPHNLGTVTYTNSYTKNVGTPVTEYPTLTLVKRATDSGLLQANAVFTLYSDSDCTNEITTFTTNSEGVADIDFKTLLADVSGIYTAYLKETAAPDGYLVDNAVYMLTLIPSEKEILRNNEFVKVTTYALNITVPANSSAEPVQNAADELKYSLNIYNRPILGEVTVKKATAGLEEADKELLEATVTIHGPITRNAQGHITGLGNTYTLTLNGDNEWTRIQTQLPIGEYLLHENMAFVHGYAWDMNNVDYGALEKEVYNNITSGVFKITADSTNIEVTITNTYEKWEAADFYIYKIDPNGAQLSGAAFQLYSDEDCTTQVMDPSITTSAVSGSNGYARFSGYTVPADDTDGIVTYYLRETIAPAGHYLSDTVYRVDIKAVTDDAGTTAYEPKISVKRNGQWVESDDFSNTSDTLTIVNNPVKGQITITKQMNGAPDDLTSVTFYVSGPNGYAKTVELTKDGNWTTTLTGLSLGEYTIIEQKADAPGYDLVTTYTVDATETTDKATVVLSETNPGQTKSNTVFAGEAEISNTYTRREISIENPTSLTVKKVGEDGTTPLEGAVFTLVRERDGETVSFTTNANGEVKFSFLAGIIDGGKVVEGKYTLTETTPPAGYAATDTKWKITVKENDGEVTIKLNEDTNIFENIWDWIIGDINDGENSYTFENNVLTVANVELADMTISKTFVGATPPDGAIIEIAVFDSNGKLVQQVELTAANSWTVKLENLPADTYTVRENSPSLHGYTWQHAAFTVTGVDETDVTAASTSVEVKVADSADVKVEIKNSYAVWDSADFYVMKTMADGITPLQGAKFNLYDANGNDVTNVYLHIDEEIHTNNGNETGTGGILHFHNFKVGEGQTAEYTLKEIAPANYYENTNVYKIVVSHTTSGYDLKITSVDGEELTVESDKAKFNGSNDVLTVVNEEILADLVIKKTFPESDLVPTSVKVDITGPNGYSNTVTLGIGNNFEVTIKGLSLGEYTIKEQDASHDGYALTVKYNGQIQDQVTITLTKDNDNAAAVVNIQNTYLLDKHNPASFTVKKVDAQTEQPLEGAVFGLYDSTGTLVGEEKTTDADGEVTFGPFTSAAEYTLKEISAPMNYHGTDATWSVTVKEKDGKIEVKLDEEKNLYENIYDWIVDLVSSGQTTAIWKDGVLTVPNVIKTGNLIINKSVEDSEEYYADAEYSFTLDASDDRFDQTFTLTADGSKVISDIPWGTTYTLTENTGGAAYTSAITDEGNGRIWAYETDIVVTNTYAYTSHNKPLALVKVDADDNAKVIPGAGFTLYADETLETKLGAEVFSDENGKLALPIEAAGTYYLAETTTPTGYHPNPNVYVVTAEEKVVVKNAGTADAVTEIQMHIRLVGLTGTTSNQIDYTYNIENTPIKTVVVNVEKIWDDGDYHARPESVQVVLLRDNEIFETVELNESNNWRYTWDNLTDEYTWTVDEKEVPTGYSKNIVCDADVNSYDFTITNTKNFKFIDVSVKKIWYGSGITHPTSVKVTLYRNGEAYDTVTLSASNNWKYTWEDLTDEFEWEVDEPSVPSGYNKTVRVYNEHSYYITNTYEDIPKTGDFTDLLGLGLMGMVGAVGFCFTAFLLFVPRKKGKYEK